MKKHAMAAFLFLECFSVWLGRDCKQWSGEPRRRLSPYGLINRVEFSNGLKIDFTHLISIRENNINVGN